MKGLGTFFGLVMKDLGAFVLKDLRRFLHLDQDEISVLWMLWAVLLVIAGLFYVPFVAFRETGRYLKRNWAIARQTKEQAE